MNLPKGDTILLPKTDTLAIDSSEPVVTLDTLSVREQMLFLLPSAFRRGEMVDRDSVLAMEAAINNEQWTRTSILMATKQSPRFCEGTDLDWWGVVLGRPRALGEFDPSYRARLLQRPAVITPEAIKAAVGAAVAQFPPAKVFYVEPAIDEIYVAPASASDPVITNSNNDSASPSYPGQAHGVAADWSAFTQPVAGQSTENQSVFVDATVRLLSYYPDDTLNPTPPGYVVPVVTGAVFWIITSGDLTNDSLSPHAQPVDDSLTSGQFNDDFEFVAPATTSDPVVVNSNNDSAAPSYANQDHGVVPKWAYGYIARQGANLGELIIAEVAPRKGGGVSYLILFDPYLGTAV